MYRFVRLIKYVRERRTGRIRWLNDILFGKLGREVSSNPLGTLLALLFLYTVCLMVSAPLVLMDLVFGSYLGPLVFLCSVVLLLRWIVRCISFPGHTGHFKDSLYGTYLTDVLHKPLTKLCKEGLKLCKLLNQRIVGHEVTDVAAVAGAGDSEDQRDNSIQNLAMGMPAHAAHLASITRWLQAAEMNELVGGLHEREQALLVDLTGALADASAAIVSSATILREASVAPRVPIEPAKAPLVAALQKSLERLRAIMDTSLLAPLHDTHPWVDSVVSFVTLVTGKPRAIRTLALPLMREQLREKHALERFTLQSDDGCTLSGAIVSVTQAGSRGASASTRSGPMEVGSSSTLGTVVYFMPNAAFYEAASLASPSWVDFYTSLGYDVCLMNYRGYGTSSGSPSPDVLCRDGEQLVRFLKQRNDAPLVVYGQSIGGLIAVRVARALPMLVDGVICDRTFCSLAAVADRMLGAWAALGMWYVAGWRTDVAAEFDALSCPKIVMQDPNDNIIHHSCSLKAGRAIRSIFGGSGSAFSVYSPPVLPHPYVMSIEVGSPLPSSTSAAGAPAFIGLDAAANVDTPFPESVMARFTASLLVLGRAAAQTSAKRREAQRGVHSMLNPLHFQRQGRTAAVAREKVEGASTLGAAHQDHQDQQEEEEEGEGEEIRDDAGTRARAALELAPKAPMTVLPSQGTAARCDCCSHGMAMWGSANVKQWLELFCGQDVFAPEKTSGLAPIDRIWVALLRIDGGHGQLLGQVIAKGHTEVRAWLACLLYYRSDGGTHRCEPDAARPRDARALETALAELQQLREIHATALDSEQHGRDNVTVPLDYVIDVLGAVAQRLSMRAAPSPDSGGVTDLLVPVHCGHTGWPGPRAMLAVERVLKECAGGGSDGRV